MRIVWCRAPPLTPMPALLYVAKQTGNMAMQILGVSGSPVENSNTDRAVKAVLNAADMPAEFVKLSEYDLNPCNACLACVEGNRCEQDDDGNLLLDKVLESDAVVVGGWAPYSSLDARTKMFIERLYPSRHLQGALGDKVGGVVVTIGGPPDNENIPPAAETVINQVSYWMMEEGIEKLGSVTVQGNVPCLSCGYGDECRVSGITMLYGENATTNDVGFNQFEDQTEAVRRAEELGRTIAEAVTED